MSDPVFPVQESTIEYRFGDWGPKYLVKGPRNDVGIVVLKPGQDFPAHHHERVEESFYTLEGEIQFYADEQLFVLREGDYFRCEPGVTHYVWNRGERPWKALFIKTPYDPKDKVDVDWLPPERRG